MRASYPRAIEWIALNDEPNETDIDLMSGLISVVLVADLWGKDPEVVARDIVKCRLKMYDTKDVTSTLDTETYRMLNSL